MNNHLLHLKFYEIFRRAVSKNWKNFAVEEGEESTSHSKQWVEQRDSNILFNNTFSSFSISFRSFLQ